MMLSLMMADLSYYSSGKRGDAEGISKQRVAYDWSVSHKERNRLHHALHGNGPSNTPKERKEFMIATFGDKGESMYNEWAKCNSKQMLAETIDKMMVLNRPKAPPQVAERIPGMIPKQNNGASKADSPPAKEKGEPQKDQKKKEKKGSNKMTKNSQVFNFYSS